MLNGTENPIRNLRRRLEMTQEEFAHTLGITVSTVNRWENGHASPSKLARACIAKLSEERGTPLGSFEPPPLAVRAATFSN